MSFMCTGNDKGHKGCVFESTHTDRRRAFGGGKGTEMNTPR